METKKHRETSSHIWARTVFTLLVSGRRCLKGVAVMRRYPLSTPFGTPVVEFIGRRYVFVSGNYYYLVAPLQARPK